MSTAQHRLSILGVPAVTICRAGYSSFDYTLRCGLTIEVYSTAKADMNRLIGVLKEFDLVMCGSLHRREEKNHLLIASMNGPYICNGGILEDPANDYFFDKVSNTILLVTKFDTQTYVRALSEWLVTYVLGVNLAGLSPSYESEVEETASRFVQEAGNRLARYLTT